jgi:D-aminopeptidase
MEPGALNAITDVTGVRVGHRTLVSGGDGDPHAIRTGVTAVFPHDGDPWREPVYAGTHILNGYGELIGINQITEWGVLMSPIVLTSSLAIGKAYDATVRWLSGRDMAAGEEVMPVVSECDDSGLNDSPVVPAHGRGRRRGADGAVERRRVGRLRRRGDGHAVLDFKGGIGTARACAPGGRRLVHRGRWS